ncbi:MAG TPA: serine/threonine-protein kinase [Dehalococcoidia bacterium]
MVIPADTIFGRYRIVAAAGQSGMAQSYRATTTGQADTPTDVILKVIDPALSAQPGFSARFATEAAALAALRHPNILPVIDYGEIDGRAYLVSPVPPTGTLRQELGRPQPLDQVTTLLAPVAAALDAAHQRGVVHGNLKPRNILIGANGAPVLDDFGLARLLEPDGQGPGGAALGTPAYMAPEQVQGQLVDGRADQYALGIIAYQLLTGSVPFSGSNPETVAWMHVREPLPAPSSRNPALAGPVEQVLLVALAREPSGRFPSCGAFVSALGRAMRATPGAPPETSATLVNTAGVAAGTDEPPTLLGAPGASGPAPADAGTVTPLPPPAPAVVAPPATATTGPATGRVDAGAVLPVAALVGGAGFLLALIATFLEWVSVPGGVLHINGWRDQAFFQIEDWFGGRNGRVDAGIVTVLALIGLALCAVLVSNRRGAAAAFAAVVPALALVVIGLLEAVYIHRQLPRAAGIGIGIWLLIVAGVVATAGMLVEGLRRQESG